MNLNFGQQTAQLVSTINQDLSAAPVIDGVTWPVPNSPSVLTVLLAAQTDARQNGLYTCTKVAGVITWSQQHLTADRVHVDITSCTRGGHWAISGTPVYGTDDVVVSRL